MGPSIGSADRGCAWNRKYLRLQLQLRESGGYLGRGPERSCPAANAICEHGSVHVSGAFRGVPYQPGRGARRCCCNCSGCCCCHCRCNTRLASRRGTQKEGNPTKTRMKNTLGQLMLISILLNRSVCLSGSNPILIVGSSSLPRQRPRQISVPFVLRLEDQCTPSK